MFIWRSFFKKGQSQGELAKYESALASSRQQQYDEAEKKYEELLGQHPHFKKAWISYAQMERKYQGQLKGEDTGAEACAAILQRAQQANPQDASIMQARGLLELKRQQHPEAAIGLLQEAVRLAPNLQPVLNWKAVKDVQLQLQQQQQQQQQQ